MGNNKSKRVVRCVDCRCFDDELKICRLHSRKIEKFESYRSCKFFAKHEQKE